MNNCPNCNSDNTTFARECYEDDHHEMIEDYLCCLDCEYDERNEMY